MHAEAGLALFAILVALYGGVGILLGRWSITMPMVFVVLGACIAASGLGGTDLAPSNELVKLLAETTLVVLLFADASTLSFGTVEGDASPPARLLGIGFPLTLLVGALVAYALFSAQGVAFALLVASILAPTDAALGLPIFTNPKVPVRIRRALNVESGLNDGIATPFVTLSLSLAVAEEENAVHGGWLLGAVEQLLIAVLVGAAVGVVGGRFLLYAHQRGWTTGTPLQLGVLALALTSYLASIGLGGNGFVAAFVGGIAFSVGSRAKLSEFAEYSETTGTLLSLAVWTLFGVLFVLPAVSAVEPRVVLYALLSLTAIRMLPVSVALFGLRLRQDTRLLMGWFGPRGLASVVFGLLAMDELTQGSVEASLLGSVVAWTILLSVLAHGLSAQPLAGWYSRRLGTASGELPELQDVPEAMTHKGSLVGASKR